MKFTKDFTPAQFEKIENEIQKFFKRNSFYFSTNYGKTKQPLKGAFNQLDNILGFAYTSSGLFAGYWACNGFNIYSKLLPEGFDMLNGFTFSEDGSLYALFENEKEESHKIKVS
jgi:hypothetical protein